MGSKGKKKKEEQRGRRLCDFAKEIGVASTKVIQALQEAGEEISEKAYTRKITPEQMRKAKQFLGIEEGARREPKEPEEEQKKEVQRSQRARENQRETGEEREKTEELEVKRELRGEKASPLQATSQVSSSVSLEGRKPVKSVSSVKEATSAATVVQKEKKKPTVPITAITLHPTRPRPKVKSPVDIPPKKPKEKPVIEKEKREKPAKREAPLEEVLWKETLKPVSKKQSWDRKKEKRGKEERRERAEKKKKEKERPQKEEKKQVSTTAVVERPKKVEVELPITVKELSALTGIRVNELIGMFMKQGLLLRINDNLTEEALLYVEDAFGVEIQIKEQRKPEDILKELLKEDNPEFQVPKVPVVTFVGHVDHGKTSLLDYIRRTRVHEQEVGGITQHIGAYSVLYKGKKITFIDTPGHEAFTEMRARGVNVTDIVVLVVAADDGVMPQTREAIAHAKAADVPILVAINKIDKPEADPDRVRRQLTEEGLLWDQWGGDVMMVEVSAVTGQGIDQLLEAILTLADLFELKADPQRPGVGTVIEAKLSEHRGPVATVILRTGTLKVGDVVYCGSTYGRVRTMVDDQGRKVEVCKPGEAVEIVGLEEVPPAGEVLVVTEDLQLAKTLAQERKEKLKETRLIQRPRIFLENLYEQIGQGQVKELPIVLKADTQGSLEALREKLEKLQFEEVKIQIIYGGVGGINASDVRLADASGAIIIGFYVTADSEAQNLAQERKVQIRTYQVIYQVIDDVKAALEGMLEPEEQEVETARLEVREVFKLKAGVIAGCYVKQGKVERSNRIRVVRNGVVVYDSTIESLRRFKEDVREVKENYECGLKIHNFNDVKVGDELIAYKIEKVARTLS